VPTNFTIGEPFSASGGMHPAATSTRKFGSTNFPPVGTTFEPNQTIYFLTDQGLSATGSHGVRLRYVGPGWEVMIPSRGIDLTFAPDDPAVKTIPDPVGGTDTIDVFFNYGYSDYVVAGNYGYFALSDGVLGTFLSGFITPESAIPFAGTASYSGAGLVQGLLHTVTSGVYTVSDVYGDVDVTVDFGLNRLNGTFSNMISVNSEGTFAFNSASFSGGVYTPYNGFGAPIDLTSAPDNPYALSGSATGYISGNIFGPNAQQLGGIWTLYDGSKAAVGVFSALGQAQPQPPSPVTPPLNAYILTVNPPPGAGDVTANPPTIARPAAASEGMSPAAPVLATPGGPEFDGTPSFPVSGTTVFPVTLSAMRLTSAGATADDATNAGGATVKLWGPVDNSTTGMLLSVPGIGVSDLWIYLYGRADQPTWGGSFGGSSAIIGSTGLSYTSWGVWYSSSNNQLGSSATVDVAGVAFGYETPASNMPTSGTATYSGTQNVLGSVYVPGKFGPNVPVVQGDASFTANFSTGQIDGNFSNMTLYINDNPNDQFLVYAYPWNSVSVSASVAGGTNKFSGTTAVTSTPAGTSAPYVLKPTATGDIDGKFFGPNAENLSGVWTLSNGDGTGSAVGAVGAAKQ
jgi:hypothetical protein